MACLDQLALNKVYRRANAPFFLPEDQVAFEHGFSLEFAMRFPEAVPLFRGVMINLNRAAGLADQSLEGLYQEGMEAADPEEARRLYDLLRRPLGPNGMAAIELTLYRPPGEQETPYERYRFDIERILHVIESDMSPYSRALLDGLYGLVGTQVLRDDHAAGRSAGTVLLQGHYLNTSIYIAEHFGVMPPGIRHAGVEAQETFVPYFIGENRALGILHNG